ncbi:hypothetical protein K503DRAFT_777330 [Rhizopogon vinicolor AM-OR11-026]|uniref:Uncharacterized protein n=1 Tax=Rhizopogon vinicolor AM-OR11-026 TaxID=1314800 RepID=A0A1B7MGK7_9AGAM|nr:hypothetical protein K503DRAFT_777330 [Rhizopogon vinicolor AM-OR11-026]
MDACNYYHADAHILLLWMPVILAHADALKLLPWMPAILAHADARTCYHGCLQILLTQEVILLTQFIGSSWLAVTTSYFLTSIRCWTCFPAPTIFGIQGSLRCVISCLISWESQLIFTQVGAAIGAGTPSGAPPK